MFFHLTQKYSYIVHKLEMPVNHLLYIFHTQFIPPGKTELVRI